MRRRQRALLVAPLLRALPRAQLTAGATAAVVVVWLLSGPVGEATPVTALQFGALALSLALASILDEPDARTVAAVAPSLLARRAMTIAVALATIVVPWAALLAATEVGAASAAALTLQLAALVLVALAFGAAFERGGAIGAAVVALAFLSACVMAPRWVLSTDFGDWRWDLSWGGLGTAGLMALLLASRDPAHRQRPTVLSSPPWASATRRARRC
jgi:hypothetical protein